MPRKSNITVSDRKDAAKTANVALLRRLQSGKVHGAGTRSLPIKEPHRWQAYLANTFANENEFFDMRERGWVPLLPEDLACSVEESGFKQSPDGYLVRGERSQEMWWKMDANDYRLLTQAKTSFNNRGIGSASKVKSDMVEAASSQLGDEAATYLNSLDGQVIDRITGGDAA